ncbi:MAG: hypothetical protein K2P09_04605 [Erysipelotrichales bacterium]|nr:hypothetical protein [Erysipelotrichales bacterium]
MSNVTDRGVLDITLVEDDKYILVIIDHLEWKYSTRLKHASVLQDKINDYLEYIASGQATKEKPGLRPVIRIIAQYSYSKYCIEFLERIKEYIKNNGNICEIEWTHHSENEEFNDGFSDDYVFEPDRVYPRLKKNWAKKPLEEISLALETENDNVSNLVMYRVMDSFIGTFVVDDGDRFIYFTYDMLPENVKLDQLQEIAFDNLSAHVQYESCESKIPGVFCIIAGGDFEAESICYPHIWEEIAEKLGDDIIMSIPTKDIVCYTKLSDKKMCKKMLKMSKKLFKENMKKTPHLIFCKDVFCYLRESKEVIVSSEYKL